MTARWSLAPVALALGLSPPAVAAEPAAVAPSEAAALRQEMDAMRAELRASRAEVEALQAQVEQLQAPTAAPSLFVDDELTVEVDRAADEAIAVWHDVHVRGRVTGDAVSVGGDVVVHDGGRVDGDAVSIGGAVHVSEGGHVAGDRVALSLGGELPVVPTGAADHHAAGSLVLASGLDETMQWLYHRVVWMLTVAGAGVVTIGLFPDRVSRVAADVSRRPVRSAIVGTLATGLLSLFSLLFVALTFGLGSPISLAIFAALGLAWLLGFVGFCQALGDKLPVDSALHGRWLALAAGVVVLAFAGSLPWVGWIGLVGVSMVGIGAALSTRFGGARA